MIRVLSGSECNSFERMLIEKLLMNYNTDVRPVENASQVLEVTVGVQPYRLLRVVRLAYFCYFQMHFFSERK